VAGCNNYTSTMECPQCGSVLRYTLGKRVECSECGEPSKEDPATLAHGGRFCTCGTEPKKAPRER
jgi:hypothetical protein